MMSLLQLDMRFTLGNKYSLYTWGRVIAVYMLCQLLLLAGKKIENEYQRGL